MVTLKYTICKMMDTPTRNTVEDIKTTNAPALSTNCKIKNDGSFVSTKITPYKTNEIQLGLVA